MGRRIILVFIGLFAHVVLTAVVVFGVLGIRSEAGAGGGSPILGNGGSPCEENPVLFSADANGDDSLDIGDVVYILEYLFNQGSMGRSVP